MFAMPDHTPVFLDELLESLDDTRRMEIEQACGQDASCAFDLIETNNPALAQNSLDTNMENLETQAVASKHQTAVILNCFIASFHGLIGLVFRSLLDFSANSGINNLRLNLPYKTQLLDFDYAVPKLCISNDICIVHYTLTTLKVKYYT